MIRHLIKGILRDKNRSLIPIIVVTIGAALTVTFSGYLRGVMGDMVDQAARFQTGHVKIMTRAYAANSDQMPNDLALLGVDSLMDCLNKDYPNVKWVKRIQFGGLLDVPDENGETKEQGPAAGMAVELFSSESGEIDRLNIQKSLITGSIPLKQGEALIGYELAEKLDIGVGNVLTYIGSTMNGSMSFANFTVSGTVRFGSTGMDKGIMIVDISDAQQVLDMYDGSGEILGFFKAGVYNDEVAQSMVNTFNSKFENVNDEFAPQMFRLKELNNMAGFIEYADNMSVIFVVMFVLAMSVVLWNTGLLGGLRRYQEFGIRLALGEEKKHVFYTLIYEAVVIGVIGSFLGTIVGVSAVWYLQIVGIDISGMVQEASMMMPEVMRAKYTPDLLYIGFIPGLVAMVMGNMLSGRGIYKRETATLFKELEV